RPAQVVVWADFMLQPSDRAESEAEIAEIVRWRRAHQPGGSNGGSVFTNPPDDSAGRLIEAAGLKGLRRGSAYVSPKHANFFQADDGGTADDVRALISEVQRLVDERMGVRLEPELPMVALDEAAAAHRIERLPWVANARVRRRWPNTVSIQVRERAPAASVPAAGGGWALVDDRGHVLAPVPSAPADRTAIEGVPPAG